MEGADSDLSEASTRTPDTGGGQVEPPRAPELWQRVLLALAEEVDFDAWGDRDRAIVVRLLQDTHRVGDRPSYEEFKAYAAQVWPASPAPRERVRRVWRKLLEDPHYRFRVRGHGEMSLVLLDRLATRVTREFGSPPLSWRMLDVFDRAADEFRRICLEDADLEAFLHARRELRSAIRMMWRVREAQLGAASTGNWMALQPDEYTEEQARDWERLKRRYASD